MEGRSHPLVSLDGRVPGVVHGGVHGDATDPQGPMGFERNGRVNVSIPLPLLVKDIGNKNIRMWTFRIVSLQSLEITTA
jgi:hypothetical protein